METILYIKSGVEVEAILYIKSGVEVETILYIKSGVEVETILYIKSHLKRMYNDFHWLTLLRIHCHWLTATDSHPLAHCH